MFRIESYITSIILSYVEKYVKNLRRQDAQVYLLIIFINFNYHLFINKLTIFYFFNFI